MDCSTPGLPVLHHLPEFAQTHVHWVGDAIQPSHPLSSPSPPAFSLSQHQGLFQWVILATPGTQSMSVSLPVLYWPHRGEELATEISRLRHGKRPAFLVSSVLCIHSWYSQDSWWTPVPSSCTTQSKNLISLSFSLFICKVEMTMLPTRLPWGPLWLKNLAANTGDAGLIPGSGISPGEGNSGPLQYSCLGNPVDKRSLAGWSPWSCKRAEFNLGTKQQMLPTTR